MIPEESTKPLCRLVGEDGNIFNLMAIARRTLAKHGLRSQGEEMYNRIINQARSYDEALFIISQYVEIV